MTLAAVAAFLPTVKESTPCLERKKENEQQTETRRSIKASATLLDLEQKKGVVHHTLELTFFPLVLIGLTCAWPR